MANTELAQRAPSQESPVAPELDDSAEALQAKATEHIMPVGIAALFAGLIAFGVYYFFAYVGWDQTSDLKGGAALTSNIGQTIAYTAIPAAIIVALAVAMARRKGRKRS